MKNALFGGINAAALTAMTPDFAPDLDRFAGHCKWLLANGCNDQHAHLTMTDIQHVAFPANRANQARLLDVLAQLLTQA